MEDEHLQEGLKTTAAVAGTSVERREQNLTSISARPKEHVSKKVRLELFFKRLSAAEPVATRDAALHLISRMLTEVENEFTDIPNDPHAWANDGRMYPPSADNARVVAGTLNVIRYRSRFHNTYISASGSIRITEIVPSGEQTIFTKQGAYGEGV